MMRVPFVPCLVLLAIAAAIPVAEAGTQEDRRAALELIGRGTAFFNAGDVVSATGWWTKAIQLCRHAGASRLEVEALARRGEAYRMEGQFHEADEDLTVALAVARGTRDEPLIAAATGALGNFAVLSRRTAIAEPLLLESRDRAQASGEADVAAATFNGLGNLYAVTNRLSGASQAYKEAVQSAETAGDADLAATAETNAARLAIDGDDPGRAIPLLRHAVDQLARTKPGYQAGLGFIAAGQAAIAGGGALSPPLASISAQAFEAARTIAEQVGNAELGALALGGFGHLHERQEHFDQAYSLTQQAMFQAQRASATDIEFRLQWQQARINRALGHNEAALANFRRAVVSLQSVRQDIPVEYKGGGSYFQNTFGPLYLQYADLLLRQASRNPAQSSAMIRQARDTQEELNKAELQDYFRDSCISNLEARRHGIDTIAPDTAVIYPVILPDRLALLVSHAGDYQQIVVPITEQQLRAEVDEFRGLLERRSTNEFLVPAQRLYSLIIRPIDALLRGRGVDTLVIVPNGILRTVPFSAMHDGGHFLIERYAVATVPGLQLVDAQPLQAKASRTLVAGLSLSNQGFSALPNVVEEVKDVHRLEGGTILLDSAFQQRRFARDLRDVDYSIVHLASHGQFGSDPSQTFILTYNGRLDLDDLENSIKFARFRDPGVELLVLDACETAVGDASAALGLAGLALKAGARSAVATIWSVSDEASGPLMIDFYQRLHNRSVSKARALQAAQRDMLADPLLSHPAYWAPFLLIGNWL